MVEKSGVNCPEAKPRAQRGRGLKVQRSCERRAQFKL